MELNIYCVDDSQLYISKIKEAVQAACRMKNIVNYRLIECSDGKQLLDKVITCPPHFVTLDINMPNMDGLSALVRLRKAFPKCVVVMVSSENEMVVKRLVINNQNARTHFDADSAKKQEMLDRVVTRVKSGVQEPGKINSVLEACASLGMDPLAVAKRYGANEFVNKPFELNEISKKFSNMLHAA